MTLSDYIDNTLGTWKTNLPWTYTTFVTEKILENYGVSLEADATDSIKLHKLADIEIWRKVLQEISQDYSYSADGSTFSRNQSVESVKSLFQNALSAGMVYLPDYSVEIVNFDSSIDPYVIY